MLRYTFTFEVTDLFIYLDFDEFDSTTASFY